MSSAISENLCEAVSFGTNFRGNWCYSRLKHRHLISKALLCRPIINNKLHLAMCWARRCISSFFLIAACSNFCRDATSPCTHWKETSTGFSFMFGHLVSRWQIILEGFIASLHRSTLHKSNCRGLDHSSFQFEIKPYFIYVASYFLLKAKHCLIFSNFSFIMLVIYSTSSLSYFHRKWSNCIC